MPVYHHPRIIAASICTAFDQTTIGSKVRPAEIVRFLEIIEKRADSSPEDFDTNGQGALRFATPDVLKCVSSGVGRRSDNPGHYVLRLYRGQVTAFLGRAHALPAMAVTVIVYTRAAYLADPDVQNDLSECARLKQYPSAAYVVVAVLADATAATPLSPARLVHNLAGGNNDPVYQDITKIREMARASTEYAAAYSVVAD